MAKGWMKSLQCKSRALDDVVHHNHPKTHPNHHLHHLILHSGNCRKSIQSVKDVVETTKQTKPRNPKPPPQEFPPAPGAKVTAKRTFSRRSEPVLQQPDTRARSSTSRNSRSGDSFFPALSELPDGHPSRNVVEIIFHTSWSPKAFPGRVEMAFKVQNLPRTVTRFEEFREVVKSRADSSCGVAGGEDHSRCVADGNEVMRFYSLGPTSSSGAYDAGGCAWSFGGVKGQGICTFSGSGGAHESGGGGRGRRAMLVCRVIAGRVCNQLGFDSLIEGRSGYDSVSRDNGELLVFDSRAVLPCFLIIYKL
ncbi:hypothetical protein ACH5RR_038633 [Cinchona calisaya]|uniref:Uncharacterized protein n=1 Tax=Cinchona calisaya TaxID=153742 RepID=A0ABD2Y1A2_9GENT